MDSDLWGVVFKFLPAKQILQTAAVVSRQWLDVARQQELWHQLCVRDNVIDKQLLTATCCSNDWLQTYKGLYITPLLLSLALQAFEPDWWMETEEIQALRRGR